MAPRINLPPLTRSIIATLIICTALNFVLRPYDGWTSTLEKPIIAVGDGVPYLSLIPGRSIIYPWVFLLASLVEQNVFGLLITGLTIFYGGRYLERAWGSKEFARFMLLVCMIPNLLSFIIYVLYFTMSKNEAALTTTISGGVAIQAGFLVSFKQLVPEHTVAIAKGMIRMRVKHFPAIFLLGNTVSGVVFGTETALFLAWLGFMTAWIYLRFYRISPSFAVTSTGDSAVIRGDASDTFAFAHFFPEPIQTPISTIADNLYNTLAALKICTPFSAEDIDAGNEQAQARAEGGLPSLMNPSGRGGRGGRREEAERRRALALKALDQRLHAATNKPQIPTIPTVPPAVLGGTNYEPDRPDEHESNGPN